MSQNKRYLQNESGQVVVFVAGPIQITWITPAVLKCICSIVVRTLFLAVSNTYGYYILFVSFYFTADAADSEGFTPIDTGPSPPSLM